MQLFIGLCSLLGVSGAAYGGYRYGRLHGRRALRRLVKRREGAAHAEDFVMQQGADGAMEIRLSKKAYKNLRMSPVEGSVVGQKNSMILRVMLSDQVSDAT